MDWLYEWMDMAKRPKRQAGTQTDVTQIDRHTDGQRDGRKESKRCQTNRHSRSVRGGQDDRKRGSCDLLPNMFEIRNNRQRKT